MIELSFGTKESGRNNGMVVREGFTVHILKHHIFVRVGAQHKCEECFCIQARRLIRQMMVSSASVSSVAGVSLLLLMGAGLSLVQTMS